MSFIESEENKFLSLLHGNAGRNVQEREEMEDQRKICKDRKSSESSQDYSYLTELKQDIIEPVYKEFNSKNVWETLSKDAPYDQSIATKIYPEGTMKEALKNRPPLSVFIEEISNATKELKKRQSKYCKEMELRESQELYQEICNAVESNSPHSMPVSRGRMVGHGMDEEPKLRPHSVLNRDTRERSQNISRKIRYSKKTFLNLYYSNLAGCNKGHKNKIS